MSLIALLFARGKRAALIVACGLVVASPALGQALDQQYSGAASTTPAEAPGPVIQSIVVRGTQRVEPATVMSYLTIHQGDHYNEQQADASLKTLFATGLFADVKFGWDGQTLTVNVVENPIINRIVFEGESKVSEKDLTKEVQLKPRTVFTRAKVQADVARIIELYRRNGKFAATVDPQVIQRPQNRIDLIFSINEGPTTGVARISFIGNKVFDDDTLKAQIATEETEWWKFLSSNDNYDPDRLTFDREQLRRFYIKRGYADFKVVSAVAELSPDRQNFYITFTVDEGPIYHFSKVEIKSNIKELTPAALRPLVPIVDGSTYNAELIDKGIDSLTNAAGTKGYAFAEIHPRVKRNRDNHTIDVIFNIEQGPRVYVEQINIEGNTRTLDKVIRREFRLVEGDAFNRVLVDRSRTRIRGLGYFKTVDIKQEPGSRPDRTVLDVKVQEQATGSLSLGAGYSSTSSFVGQFSYTQTNLFGRGQSLQASVQLSYISKQFQLSFTEPYFLDHQLSAGFDLYKVLSNFDQADYEIDSTGGTLRMGFPTSEYASVGLRYTYRVDKVRPYSGAPTAILLSAGTASTSSLGYTYAYNTLDDLLKPRHGVTFSFSQDIAGFGGSLKYLRSATSASWYHPVFTDDLIGKLSFQGGYIQGYGGQHVRLNERFFKGGDDFRGFNLAGVGPRELNVSGQGGQNAIGGEAFLIGSAELRLPDFLPSDYGISLSLFSDFGTVGHIAGDPGIPRCGNNRGGGAPCIKDNMAFRASGGLAIGWKSPFGPVEIDIGVPFIKEDYDKSQIIRFSAGTGL